MTTYDEYLNLHAQCEYPAPAASQVEWQSWSLDHQLGSIGVMKLRIASIQASKKRKADLYQVQFGEVW